MSYFLPWVRIPENWSTQQGFTRSVLPLAVRFQALTQLLLTHLSFKSPALSWKICPKSFQSQLCSGTSGDVLVHHLEVLLQQAEHSAWRKPGFIPVP